MKSLLRLPRRRRLLCALGALSLAPMLATGGCGDESDPDGGGAFEPQLTPGDLCSTPQPPAVRARFSPDRVFLPPCAEVEVCTTRTVKLIVEPDFCENTPITFTSSDPAALPAPKNDKLQLYKSEVSFELSGARGPGRYTITGSLPRGDETDATATLDVVVLDKEVPSCDGTASDPSLTEEEMLAGTGGLAGASITIPKGANKPEEKSFLWRVEPFAASLACGSMTLPSGYQALSPAITFGPADLAFKRDIPLSVPVNPALMPSLARLRHISMVYSGPKFKEPRVVPIADPHFVELGGRWALTFKAPRLGTYQLAIKGDAGTVTRKRSVTHRAVTGVSMGGMGSSMFGLRHHDKFDVIAPLGGPASWTWLMHHLEKNHMGGFPSIAPGTQLADIQLTRTECQSTADCAAGETCMGKTDTYAGKCSLLPAPEEPYEHTQVFNNWWNEFPRTGTGGAFPRRDYSQILRDLALLMGNPNGENLTPGAENLPAGVRPDDPSVIGDRTTNECSIFIDPIDNDPNKEKQKLLDEQCPLERCANTLTLSNYFDDEYNPDGTFPVITVCDGTPTTEAESPWANAWKAEGPNQYPLEVALAVDYNGNGVRDEMEPLIRAGHEPWRDTGPDGVASEQEPGYQAGVNEDPAGDDYDAQYNPTGLENNHRYESGEPFDDVGLDGVPNTPQQPATGWANPGDGYDVGEGDGKFTVTRGLQRMWDFDPSSVIRRQTTDAPGGDLDDEALARIDTWTDGGTRDLFNFHLGARHFAGSMKSRGRDTTFYTDFSQFPGFNPDKPTDYTPSRMPWEDVPGSVFLRYGMIDPTANAFENGNGQHVGTVDQIAWRLQTALYYIGSRWPEPELRHLVALSQDKPNPELPICQIDGSCTEVFTDSRGRSGPYTINLPPGYGHEDQKDRRYPVIYLLHGYGMTPEDLGAAIIFVSNWMNNGADSISTRLPKAIIVYVDGRCRVAANGQAECIRGNFFNDSGRPGGMMADSWWMDLMQHVDQHYRTLGSSTIDWQE
ncbi:MAG: hypothetical protein HOV80_35445 [Polyangiaceae bacterium]|nr:hypothetical protein [Polyangiaceae bacterium]